jgi:hypothetical protein
MITQYTTGVSESFSGSIGWNQTSGLNASIGGGLSLSNSSTTVVPPESIQYTPNSIVNAPSWLFISNNGNLPEFIATNSWIWVVPFKDYATDEADLNVAPFVDVTPVNTGGGFQLEYTAPIPLPFGDTFQLQDPVVTGVNVPTIAPGQEFTIKGASFYPALVEGVVIGGQALGPSSFNVVDNNDIEVVAPNSPGNAQSVVVKTVEGFSNSNITINISGSSQVSVQAQPVAAVAGQAFTNAVVATVTDSDTNASPAGFSATIDWGDGTTSNGTVASTGTGSFFILAGHTYATAGSFTIGLAVTGPGNTKATATTTATVTSTSNNGGPTNLVANPVKAVANQAFTNVILGTFTDSDPNANPADFTAAIDWGDGISTASTTVTMATSQTFDVLGTHTYAKAGAYTFTIQVTDNQNRRVTATGSATVTS